MSWKDKVWEFLQDEPIYKPAKSDPYAEGWKFAFEQTRDRLKIAEKRLALLTKLADGIIEFKTAPQYGRDIKTILLMTEEQLEGGYQPEEDPTPARDRQFVPGDEVRMSIDSQYWQEYNGRKGIVTYGPDTEGGWQVCSAPGTIRCMAEELTMVTRREDR